MADLGPAELLIVLLVVALIFGGSRLADLGGSLGKSVREFRKAIQEDDDTGSEPAAQRAEAAAARDESAEPAHQSRLQSIPCPACGSDNVPAALFCQECSASLRATSSLPSATDTSPITDDRVKGTG